MGPYNGFSGAYREQVGRAMAAMVKEGTLPAPKLCRACGQTRGVIQMHLEDYDRPESYIALCFPCHMVVHCRFGSPVGFDAYVVRLEGSNRVRVGAVRNYQDVLRLLKGEPVAWEDVVPPRPVAAFSPQVLRVIASGELDPRKKGRA